MSQNNISEILIKLGIKDEQKGCSNGTEWFGSDSKISSFSPVDGSELGKVTTGNKDDYEKLIQMLKTPLNRLEKFLLQKEENLLDNLVTK